MWFVSVCVCVRKRVYTKLPLPGHMTEEQRAGWEEEKKRKESKKKEGNMANSYFKCNTSHIHKQQTDRFTVTGTNP